MNAIENLDQFLAGLQRSGIDIDHVSTAEGRAYKSEETARIVGEKYGCEVIRMASGWLVANKPVPRAGDTLVVAKNDGRAEVFRLNASGQWTDIRNGTDVSDIHTAWEIASTNFGPNGSKVWFREESEGDSEIRPHAPR
jgi:hypothetical protein